jgi:hypothetical protein
MELRQVHHAGPDVCTRPGWLRKPETFREGVGAYEASDMAREIFQRWTKKVRESACISKGPRLIYFVLFSNRSNRLEKVASTT